MFCSVVEDYVRNSVRPVAAGKGIVGQGGRDGSFLWWCNKYLVDTQGGGDGDTDRIIEICYATGWTLAGGLAEDVADGLGP